MSDKKTGLSKMTACKQILLIIGKNPL